jgi:hypothetical protein
MEGYGARIIIWYRKYAPKKSRIVGSLEAEKKYS